eukprot:Amastigsp_a841956_130.p2 type:complete len:257 gc:universal Amastigsp_a841956_130:792-22(-)
MREDLAGKVDCAAREHRDLEPVLARVPAARDVALVAAHHKRPRGHERKALERLGVRDQRRKDGRRRGALQRKQRVVRERLQPDLEPSLVRAPQVLLEMRHVLVVAPRIDDDVEMIRHPRDHRVVDDAAALVRVAREPAPAGLENANVARNKLFDKVDRVCASKTKLPHVRHIKEPGLCPHVVVRLQHPVRVLHRHRPARIRNHARSQLEVQIVQRSLLERRICAVRCRSRTDGNSATGRSDRTHGHSASKGHLRKD